MALPSLKDILKLIIFENKKFCSCYLKDKITVAEYNTIQKKLNLPTILESNSISNTIDNIYAAGLKFAEELSPNISKSDLEIVINDQIKHEARKRWGFNPNGPNVEQFKIGICKKLFNQPAHPSSIPRIWLSLPWSTKEDIFVRGRSPVYLSGDMLTKKEATEWLSSIAINKKFRGEEWKSWKQDPLLWITRYVNLKEYVPRSKLIAEWIAYQDKKNKGIFEKERIQHLPDGREIKFSYSSIIDEIQDDDLVAGVKTNVQRAFQKASERNTSSYIEKLKKMNVVFPTFPWKLDPYMEYLDTPEKLADEGCKLSHCVAGYAPMAIKGDLFIVSVKTDQGRSTVEIDKNGDVRQHRSKHNSEPPVKNKKIVDNWQVKTHRLKPKEV
jgi:hypothetical protein